MRTPWLQCVLVSGGEGPAKLIIVFNNQLLITALKGELTFKLSPGAKGVPVALYETYVTERRRRET